MAANTIGADPKTAADRNHDLLRARDHDARDHLGVIRQPHPGAIVTQRENGEYKRLRGTPLPAAFVIGSRAAVGVVVAVVMSALLPAIGRLAYNVRIPHSTMPGIILAVIVGAAAFSCIAFAVATRISSAEAAAPATNLTVLPLYFISGVFVAESIIPRFPAQHRHPLPDPSPRRNPPAARRPHTWQRHRRHRPAHRRGLGHRRAADRGAHVPVVAAQRLCVAQPFARLEPRGAAQRYLHD